MNRSLLQLSHDDHRAGEVHEAEEVYGDVLIAYDQTAEVLDPAIESLDLVSLAIATQPTAILSGWLDSILTMRADQLNAAFPQALSQGITVGSQVVDQSLRGFPTKKMWTIRGCVDLYFLVFIHLGTRRCWISPSTVSPESAWVCQQARNFLMHAEDVELPHRFVMRDNDAKYSAAFDAVFEASDTEIKRNARFSPNLRAHVERFIQTQQFECLDKFVVVNEKHLNLINREFQRWYNYERPHSARDHLPPGCQSQPAEWATVKLNDVVCETRLGGALKSYWRRAG